MGDITNLDPATILTGDADSLTPDIASTLATHPLEGIETEYPHAAHVLESPDGPPPPSDRHPVFYGCFDWHSSVHSHWNLIRQLRLVDDHPDEPAIRESIDDRLTPANVDTEVTYFEDHPNFENPYGWAWYLRLIAELHRWDDPHATEWRDTLAPLTTKIRDLVDTQFLDTERPFRVGTHHNTAFALATLHDYATITGDTTLTTRIDATATDHYANDRDAPVEYEPLGWDFLSPTLQEADLMRRVYDADTFHGWLDTFLPDVTVAPYDSILTPIPVNPDKDQDIALHYVGLNLSNAWCFAGLADTVPDPSLQQTCTIAAIDHIDASLQDALTDEYAGSHWLASFLLYLLTRNAGGIAPP